MKTKSHTRQAIATLLLSVLVYQLPWLLLDRAGLPSWLTVALATGIPILVLFPLLFGILPRVQERSGRVEEAQRSRRVELEAILIFCAIAAARIPPLFFRDKVAQVAVMLAIAAAALVAFLPLYDKHARG